MRGYDLGPISSGRNPSPGCFAATLSLWERVRARYSTTFGTTKKSSSAAGAFERMEAA
jgi:hypothetical protein